MEVLWNIIFWLIPIWTFILIPFATFYYEADDGMLMAGTAYAPNPIKKSRLRQAIYYQIFVIIIVCVLFTILYVLLSDTKIPVIEYIGYGPNEQGLMAPQTTTTTNVIWIGADCNADANVVLECACCTCCGAAACAIEPV